jgi:hypothetical protein
MFPFISRGNKLSLKQSHYFVLPEGIELFKPRYGTLDNTSGYLFKTLLNISGCEKLIWLILLCVLTFILLNTAKTRPSSGRVS